MDIAGIGLTLVMTAVMIPLATMMVAPLFDRIKKRRALKRVLSNPLHPIKVGIELTGIVMPGPVMFPPCRVIKVSSGYVAVIVTEEAYGCKRGDEADWTVQEFEQFTPIYRCLSS